MIKKQTPDEYFRPRAEVLYETSMQTPLCSSELSDTTGSGIEEFEYVQW